MLFCLLSIKHAQSLASYPFGFTRVAHGVGKHASTVLLSVVKRALVSGAVGPGPHALALLLAPDEVAGVSATIFPGVSSLALRLSVLVITYV